ncbi:hypothetical protein Vafri_20566 [Volvox africanus]|uniref:Uncharacterized protein n=1 Tax=Volvox africanus TaxID=51714 RepID=A0A8J4FD80_9CHLO|nr:hypothetical protein Vafri_20566 [Volvox africanus]
MSYPKVTIVNSTPYVARGQVDYLSLFCSDDGYTVSANGATWTGPDRGVCLVKRVSATLNTPQGNVEAEAYTSSGTAYSQYAIIYQPNGNGFAVTRVVSKVLETGPTNEAVSVEPEAEPTAEPQCRPLEQATSK